jgi:hypothetical protein
MYMNDLQDVIARIFQAHSGKASEELSMSLTPPSKALMASAARTDTHRVTYDLRARQRHLQPRPGLAGKENV